MKCSEFAEFIADYLAGELPAPDQEVFERHMSRCENCRQYLANYQEATAMGRMAFAPDAEALPEDVPAEMVEAILKARKRGEGA